MFDRRGKRALALLPILFGAVSTGALSMVPATGAIPVIEEPSVVLPDASAPRLDADLTVNDDTVTAASTIESNYKAVRAAAIDQVDDKQVTCMAKVIIHEAGSESRRGQVAVAQVIRTRLQSGRFPETACAVVKQRGQFFDVDSYNPSRDDDRWAQAVEIARETLAGQGEEVAPGAMFFHAAWSRGPWMSKRGKVTQIGGQVFYR